MLLATAACAKDTGLGPQMQAVILDFLPRCDPGACDYLRSRADVARWMRGRQNIRCPEDAIALNISMADADGISLPTGPSDSQPRGGRTLTFIRTGDGLMWTSRDGRGPGRPNPATGMIDSYELCFRHTDGGGYWCLLDTETMVGFCLPKETIVLGKQYKCPLVDTNTMKIVLPQQDFTFTINPSRFPVTMQGTVLATSARGNFLAQLATGSCGGQGRYPGFSWPNLQRVNFLAHTATARGDFLRRLATRRREVSEYNPCTGKCCVVM